VEPTERNRSGDGTLRAHDRARHAGPAGRRRHRLCARAERRLGPGTYPPPSAFVVDTADVVSAAVEQQIAGQLTSFEDRTGHQMAVVVVPSLDGQSVDEYAHGLFEQWGIGRAGVDDGALLLVAVQDRKVRVQVGQGLSSALSDDAAVGVVDGSPRSCIGTTTPEVCSPESKTCGG
jgi:uncharacterized protein